MRKSTKMMKRFVALFLIVLMSIDIMAAVVSNDDGSAFVTKQQFEELKASFNEQIDRYNNSLDSKIDGKIASYLDGIRVSTRVELVSYINKLKAYKFSRNFNLFGDSSWSGSRIGNQYKYWSYYGGTWGIDRGSQKIAGHYMIGIRGGTGVVSISEQTEGSYMDRYVVCNKSAWKNTKPSPSYGISSYIYYSMMWLCSNYGTGTSNYWTTAYNTNVTGSLSGSNFGTNFTTYTPTLPTTTSLLASIMYTATPIDINQSSHFDANVLPGSAMDETKKAYYIMTEDLMKLGSSDGTFNSVITGENAWWKEGSGRNYPSWENNVNLYITKYKRKYQEYYYKDFFVDTVSLMVDKDSYYYSGLPLFQVNDNGKVTMKIKATNSGSDTTTIAIKEKQFDNSDIGTGGIDGVSDNECTFTDWEFTTNTEYTIEFNVKKDTIYWIKACPSTANTTTKLETTSIILEKE